MTTFEELVGNKALLRAIERIGWETPTPIQVKGIPPTREGCDVVGIAQTGTGKTAAFLLPILECSLQGTGERTLILCPTRELALQVSADARELARFVDFRIVQVYGGVRLGPQKTQLSKGWDMIVATPGRLLDHLERGSVDLADVRNLVLDEADRMLDMGFRPQIEGILRALPRERRTVMLSATMPPGVHALALRYLREPVWIEADPSATAAETVEQAVYPVKPELKPELLIELLANASFDHVLVFTRTKIGADVLHSKLERAGLEAAVLHGDRDMRERRQALERFATGEVRVMVATDVAQRGLDIEGISHVVNYDVPDDPDEYVHRIGRTGRAGATGTAVTFMTGAELGFVRGIERALGEEIPRISIDGFDYAGGTNGAREPKARANRTGGRMGARSTDELSPEELEKLLGRGR